MRADGVTDFYGCSGYRSYDTQVFLYQRKTNYYRSLGYGETDAARLAATVVAPPGASEHQSGMALDFATGENGGGLTDSFAATKAGLWLREHSWEYGFILRYPKGKSEITGYIWEPWHFRYVGEAAAAYMNCYDLCLEEFYQVLETDGVAAVILNNAAQNQVYAFYSRYADAAARLPGTITRCSQAYYFSSLLIVTTLPPDLPLFDLIGYWGEPRVRHLNELGLISGYPDNTFRAPRTITRAELVTLLDRTARLLYGEDGEDDEDDGEDDSFDVAAPALPYADVTPGDYYYAALLRCYQDGLLPDSFAVPSFSPTQPVCRGEAAQAFANLLAGVDDSFRDDAANAPDYPDLTDIDENTRQAVRALAGRGIVEGKTDGLYHPELTLNRGEFSQILDRIMETAQ